jgi:hypothetical protein
VKKKEKKRKSELFSWHLFPVMPVIFPFKNHQGDHETGQTEQQHKNL